MTSKKAAFCSRHPDQNTISAVIKITQVLIGMIQTTKSTRSGSNTTSPSQTKLFITVDS